MVGARQIPRGATYKTLIIKDLLDFRVVIFTTLKLVKPLSIRQLRDAPRKGRTECQGLGQSPNKITRHHQMPGRSWRAGKTSGDGKPAGPDRPLEKGDGGIE